MEAISVKNLSVAYENNTIIEDMSLSIPKGKISIIIGANGCGKSTLLPCWELPASDTMFLRQSALPVFSNTL